MRKAPPLCSSLCVEACEALSDTCSQIVLPHGSIRHDTVYPGSPSNSSKAAYEAIRYIQAVPATLLKPHGAPCSIAAMLGFQEQRVARAEEVESQTACRRLRAKLSMIMPAIWRPLPTPAPSPMKKPAPARHHAVLHAVSCILCFIE